MSFKATDSETFPLKVLTLMILWKMIIDKATIYGNEIMYLLQQYNKDNVFKRFKKKKGSKKKRKEKKSAHAS